MNLYTKKGRPLQVSNNIVYSKSGIAVGRIVGHKVFGTDGRYVGTIDGDRLVYRRIESAEISGGFIASRQIGSAAAHAVASAINGEEPNIPD